MIGAALALEIALCQLGTPYATPAQIDFNLSPTIGNDGVGEDPLYLLNITTPQVKQSELLTISAGNGRTVNLKLENKTSEALYIGINQQPYVWFEALIEGEWKPIQYMEYRSAFDSGYSKFEPNQVATAAHTFAPGNFNTQIRAAMYISRGSFTTSNSIPFAIHPSMFTMKYADGSTYTIAMDNRFPRLKKVE